MNRYQGLDFLKLICAFGVICIHIPFPGILGEAFTAIARIAVPVFFMITGYFYTSTCNQNRQHKQLLKIFRLFLGANVLFFLWSIVKTAISGESLPLFFANSFRINSLFKFFLLNESPFGSHLWYLGAILYVLLIILLFEKKYKQEKLYPLIPILLMVDLIFGKYSLLLLGKTVPYVLVRNFLFVGLPYFLIGDALQKKQLNIKPQKLIISAVFFTCTTWLERFMIKMINMDTPRDHYISTTFLAVTVFLIALHAGKECHRNWYKFSCFIGSKLSLNIYLLHPILIVLYKKLLSMLASYGMPKAILDYTAPIVILLLSTLIAWGIFELQRSRKGRLPN